MPVIGSFLMCHAPITIPKLGKDKSKACTATTLAMEHAAHHALSLNPDQIIIVSPHTPRLPDKFGILNQRVSGNFSHFGHPNIRVNLPVDPSMNQEICSRLDKHFEMLPKIEVDHGAMVPLWFFQQLGWEGRTNVIGLPAMEPFVRFKDAIQALEEILAKDPQHFVIIASGELSHCVKQDSPVAFHPDGQNFDNKIKEMIVEGQIQRIELLDDELISNAAQDCVESLKVASYLTNGSHQNSRLISYEAPFGVGYCVAILSQSA